MTSTQRNIHNARLMQRIFVLLLLLIWQGCAANKELRYHLDLSRRLQEEGRLEEALTEYEMALKIDPSDKEALSGIKTVKIGLSEQYTTQAIEFMEENKLTSAKERLRRVFQLIPKYPPAIDYMEKVKEKEEMIQDMYERAIKLNSDHEYLEAKKTYKKILRLNVEENKTRDLLDKLAEEAWQYYVKLGNDFTWVGEWSKANEYYLIAKSFKTNEAIKKLLERASKAMKAIQLCGDAEMALAKGQAEQAFTLIEEAKTLFPEEIPQCGSVYQEVRHSLAHKNYMEGLNFQQRNQWEKAYEAFLKAVTYGPNYRDSSSLSAIVREEFLKELYRETVSLIHQRKWEDAFGKVSKIKAISPFFGESSDLIAESIWNVAEGYYAKGLKYSNSGFHANAWIQFNAVASIVPNFLDVKGLMENEKLNIHLRTHKNLVVIPFFSLDTEPVLMPFIKKELNSFLFQKHYRNISLDRNPLTNKSLYISSNNWLEAIKSLSAEWVLVGWINYIKIDHSVKSRFSQKKYMAKEEVISPAYIQAQDELKLTYEQLQTEVLEKRGKSEKAKLLRNKINELESKISRMQPLIEEEREKVYSQSVKTHRLDGYGEMTVKIVDTKTMADIFHKEYRSTKTYTDDEIEPHYEFNFPGDPLQLPSVEEFKQVLAKDMLKGIETDVDSFLSLYGKDFFLRARAMEKRGEWEEAVESYADFLEAYADKGSHEVREANAFLQKQVKKGWLE